MQIGARRGVGEMEENNAYTGQAKKHRAEGAREHARLPSEAKHKEEGVIIAVAGT